MLPGQTFTDASDYQHRSADNIPVGPDRAAEWVLRSHWSRPDVPFFLPISTATSPTAAAYLNRGRWVVDCPFCASSQLAARTDHRTCCPSCLNEAVGAAWIPVTWPDEVQAIEDALRPRLTVNANWTPGQTVADLVAENAENGIA